MTFFADIKDINEFVKTELEGLIGNLAGRDTKGIKQEIRFILERAIDGTNLLENGHLQFLFSSLCLLQQLLSHQL